MQNQSLLYFPEIFKVKILITGGTGFLGSWISRILAENHEVILLTRKSSKLHKISDLKNIKVVSAEVSDWQEWILYLAPEVLILNDWSGVENLFRDSPLQYENVERIRTLASTALKAKVKTVVGVGSQAELGPVESEILESAPDNPTSIYGRAKVETRTHLEKLFSNSQTRFVWMRIFSTYGPLDEGSWLIPNIVDSLSNNRTTKMTLGAQEWSYLHAYDLAKAFATVIEDLHVCGTVNAGNPETILIREVGLKIARILRKESLLDFGALDYRPDQVMKLRPICETLTRSGWSPLIRFEPGITQTVQWLLRKEISPIRITNDEVITFKLPARP